jgi:DNA-binding IclR family transcriptional regulator
VLASTKRDACSGFPSWHREESGSRGGTRRERYHNALGSARETGACLDVAEALGYVARVDASVRDRLDHVRATLAKNVM